MTASFEFLDVGQGDSSIVALPGNRFGVIDFGTEKAGATVLAPEVSRRVGRGEKFLFAALTHFDDDHCGGLATVLDIAEPELFLLPVTPLDLLEEWLRRIDGLSAVAGIARLKKAKCVQKRCDAGLSIPVASDLRIVALSPDYHFESELRSVLQRSGVDDALGDIRRLRNRGSLALYVEYLKRSMVLLGEVEADQYSCIWEVIGRFVVDYVHPTVVKLSHHGARENNPSEVFQYFGVAGSLMVASAGGRYGHPDVTVMHQVEQVGAIPACTRLGRGCELIIESGRPSDIVDWRRVNARRVLQSLPGNPTCHGTIVVELSSSGVGVRQEAVQTRCPFGARQTPAFQL